MSYGIKEGYRENPGPVYFLDDVTATRGMVFQPDVYTFAEMLARQVELQHNSARVKIVDVGCGWGDKLAKMHEREPGFTYTGVDFGENIAHCKSEHPWGDWHEIDLEDDASVPWGDIVICSDVIEHLVNPMPLLHAFATMGSGAIFVISTPERDIQYGYDHMGPSSNLCHVREWNAEELHNFLEGVGLTILHHGLTRGSDQSWAMGTQLVVCR